MSVQQTPKGFADFLKMVEGDSNRRKELVGAYRLAVVDVPSYVIYNLSIAVGTNGSTGSLLRLFGERSRFVNWELSAPDALRYAALAADAGAGYAEIRSIAEQVTDHKSAAAEFKRLYHELSIPAELRARYMATRNSDGLEFELENLELRPDGRRKPYFKRKDGQDIRVDACTVRIEL